MGPDKMHSSSTLLLLVMNMITLEVALQMHS